MRFQLFLALCLVWLNCLKSDSVLQEYALNTQQAMHDLLQEIRETEDSEKIVLAFSKAEKRFIEISAARKKFKDKIPELKERDQFLLIEKKLPGHARTIRADFTQILMVMDQKYSKKQIPNQVRTAAQRWLAALKTLDPDKS